MKFENDDFYVTVILVLNYWSPVKIWKKIFQKSGKFPMALASRFVQEATAYGGTAYGVVPRADIAMYERLENWYR